MIVFKALVSTGNGWLHEIKHDGYRLMIRKAGGSGAPVTRRGYDWTARYPRVTAAAALLKAASATVDGELVCLKQRLLQKRDSLRR